MLMHGERGLQHGEKAIRYSIVETSGPLGVTPLQCDVTGREASPRVGSRAWLVRKKQPSGRLGRDCSPAVGYPEQHAVMQGRP